MNYQKITQYLLGAAFIVFGVVSTFQLGPVPEFSGAAGAMLSGLYASGYFFIMVGILHLIAGILLVLNKYVNLALIYLFIFLTNAVIFHAAIERSGLLMSIVFWLLAVYLINGRWDDFSVLVK